MVRCEESPDLLTAGTEGKPVITYHRICIKDAAVQAQNGDRQEIKRGQEYLTSAEKDGTVIVFSRYWEPFPVELFAGEVLFTGATRAETSKASRG